MVSNLKSNLFENINGIVLINKTSHMTSYDVVRQVKKNLF